MTVRIHILDTETKLEFSYDPKDRGAITEHLCRLLEDELTDEGIPVYIEASAWCELAAVGEVFEHGTVRITVVEEPFF